MVGQILVAIPKYTKGKLSLEPKKKDGTPLRSKTDALDAPRSSTAQMMPPKGTIDTESLATEGTDGIVREIKE